MKVYTLHTYLREKNDPVSVEKKRLKKLNKYAKEQQKRLGLRKPSLSRASLELIDSLPD